MFFNIQDLINSIRMENQLITMSCNTQASYLADFIAEIPVLSHGIHQYNLSTNEGSGYVRFIDFGRGFTSIDLNFRLKDHLTLVLGNEMKDILYFMYVTQGICFYEFKNHHKSKRIEEYKSSSTRCEVGNEGEISISKDMHFIMNIISLDKELYFKRFIARNNESTNKYDKLFDSFKLLKNHIHVSSYSLKIAEQLRVIHNKTETFEIVDSIRLESRYYFIVALHLDQLFGEIYGSKQDNKLNKTQLNKICKVTEFIVDNPDHDHSIKKLCDHTGLSPAKLQEGFKCMHATTVADFVRNARIEKAEILLANTDLNISEVVYSIGFTSRSYFCKIFRQKYGCSPREYKKRPSLLQ